MTARTGRHASSRHAVRTANRCKKKKSFIMNLDLLKETFANFIRARGMDRHFHRIGVDMFRMTDYSGHV